jgi:serine/threonine protein kinase
MPLPPNTLLGRYEIRTQIGAGGMGEVYLAEDTRLDRKVAVKLLPADVATDEDRSRRNFNSPRRSRSSKLVCWRGRPIFHEYDVSPDGQRFLIGTLVGDTKAAPPTVILKLAGGLEAMTPHVGVESDLERQQTRGAN